MSTKKGVPRAWALIDDDDIDLAKNINWSLTSHGRVVSYIGKFYTYLDRYIMDIDGDKDKYVKHTNNNYLDCRKNNLLVRNHKEFSDRHNYLKNRFNISETEYNKILFSQNGKCGICEVEPNLNGKNNDGIYIDLL